MICENCGKEVNGPYCPNCGHPTEIYSNIKMEYDPDNDFIDNKNKDKLVEPKNEEVKKTVIRRGDMIRQAEVESAPKEKETVEEEKIQPKQKVQQSKEPVIQQENINEQNNSDGFFSSDIKSVFTGGAFGLFFVRLLVGFVSLITLGIAFPFMLCFYYKWIASKTVINGRQMYFDGNGVQLLGKYVLWMFLTIITVGIYSFFLVIKMKKWIVSHTHYVGEEALQESKSKFTGGTFRLFFVRLGAVLLTIVTLTFGAYWARCALERWKVKHTVIDGYKQTFDGKGMQLMGKCAVWVILTVITVGIYSFWFASSYKKWLVSHTVGVNKECSESQENK